MEYVLTAENLCKRYGRFTALGGLSIHIPKGAVYGLVGKNGAGKTTLIRLICGLQTPTSGRYALYGEDSRSSGIVKARRRMGAVVETPSIYLDMTAWQNLEDQYRVLGLPSFEGIPELLKLTGLEHTGKKKAGNFSLGMKQRLGIAVALAGNPDFLVLDEPVNGLDPQGIVEIRELLLKLNRERQITLLISSHILDELARLATHYGFIDDGRMVREVSAEEVERACRKSMRLTVSDTAVLARVLDYYYFHTLPYFGGFLAVFTGIFLGTEYSDGTVRNKIIAGHRRRDIYLANLITCAAAAAMLYLLWALAGLSGLPFLESEKTGAGVWVGKLAAGLCTVVSLAAIFVLIGQACARKAAGASAAIVAAIFLILAGSLVYNALTEPEMLSEAGVITMSEEGVVSYEPGQIVPNPNYVDGPLRTVLQMILFLLPTGQQIWIADEPAVQPAVMIFCSMLATAAATGCGLALFGRKDLK